MKQPSEIIDKILDGWTDKWVTVLDSWSRSSKCIRSDVFYFYLRLIRLVWCILFLFMIDTVIEKWSSIFVVPVKENNNHASILLTLLDRNFPGISFLCISVLKISIWKVLWVKLECIRWCLFYSMFISKDYKVFWIPSFDKTEITGIRLFEIVLQTVYLY